MYILDTDTLVYALNGDARVLAALENSSGEPKAMSVISYGELYHGALRSQRVEPNLARVRRTIELFQVFEVTTAVIETFARIKANLQQRGIPLDDFDLVIAATAMSVGYRLVTNNERHFRRIDGLAVENWARG